MAANSAIEWTDHTFNPWRGCTKVHAGCTNCYAEVNYSVKMHGVKWGPNGTRVKLSGAGWREPLKWNREAEAAGERRRVFCASLADVFEDWQGPVLSHDGERLYRTGNGKYCFLTDVGVDCRDPATLDDLRRDLFALIDATPWLDWLLLTKRPENIRRMWPKSDYTEGRLPKVDAPWPNIWLGTSISDQKTADEWIPRLLENRDLAPVIFLSCEPLLGPIELDPAWTLGITNIPAKESLKSDLPSWAAVTSMDGLPRLDWVIVGGESGHNARPMEPDWARGIRDQCEAAGVPFFFKQWGEWLPYEESGSQPLFDNQAGGNIDSHAFPVGLTDHDPVGKWWMPHLDGAVFQKVGKHDAGRLLDGREWNEYPKEQVHA